MSDNETLKAVIIQNKFRLNQYNINLYNLNYSKIYERLNNVLNRVQNSYEVNILNQDIYNNYLELIDKFNDQLKSLPYPLKLHHLLNKNIIDLKINIFNLKKEILELICLCGCNDIHTIIKILIEDYNKIYESSESYLNFLNEIFIPTGSKIIKIENSDDDNMISIKDSDYVKQSLKEKINGAIIEIPCKKNKLKIYGYFKQDPLNIYKQNNILKIKINHIKNKCCNFNLKTSYIDAYINQINLKDIMTDSIDKISRKINRDFDFYEKLRTQLLSSLVKDFLMSNLSDQRKILTLFLISDDEESIHMAYLLYDMITTTSDSLKPNYMVEDIFKNLHWTVQKKFKIAIKNVEDYRKKLLQLNEDDISYEDRILQMKTTDNIKSKAMDKLKEIKSNKDSSKAQTYLDGLLKIPFGSYKKEKIIMFLKDFSNSIDNLFIEIEKDINKLSDSDEMMQFIKLKLNNLIENKDLKTENKINDLINNIEITLKQINDKISSNDSYKDLVYINEELNSDQKLEKIKSLNNEIENCDDSDILNKLENEITINIKNELKSLKNKISYNCESPKILKGKDVNFSYEYEVDSNNNDNIIKNFNDYKSIESHLLSLLNEWTLYKHSKKEYMLKSKEILNNCVHGQKDAKKHIERLIAQWINGKMEGNVFGFHGPPGVGKTTLCKKGLAKCLHDDSGDSRPFSFIALGGANHGSYLDGHHYTYLGSTWGRIVEILIETKCMNPIIYIDELDKVSRTENGKEIIGILTHLTDPSQNEEFTDKYFSGIKLDLSKCLVVFSYNDSKLIDPILKDRITEINVKSITKKEKIYICKNFLLPEILGIVGYEKNDFVFEENILHFIIDTYTCEAGVRKLKEKLFEVIRDVNLNYITGEKELILPFIVTEEYIKNLFSEKSKVKFTKIAKKPQVGLINGLYATSSGIGGITIIEVMRTPSDTKLSLELTGSQGDVMKESMKCAKTIAWNLLPDDIKIKIKTEWDDFGAFGLHIHCPEAAMPKDGPSAGITITSAILSRLCNLKIKNTIAMTGEIDLNGKVHAIGGLESKLDGAKRAGVTKVLIPQENEDDYNIILKNLSEEDKGKYNENFEVQLVDTFNEVIKEVFVENDLNFNFVY